MPRIIIKNPPRGPGQNTPVVCRVTLDIYLDYAAVRLIYVLEMGGPRTATNHKQGCRGSPAPEVSGSRGLLLLLFSTSYCSPAPEVSGSYCSLPPIVLRLPRSPAPIVLHLLLFSGSRGLRLSFSERGGPYIIFITARKAISTLI